MKHTGVIQEARRLTATYANLVESHRTLTNIVEAQDEKIEKLEAKPEAKPEPPVVRKVTVTFSATAWDQLCKQLDIYGPSSPDAQFGPPTWHLGKAIRRAIEGYDKTVAERTATPWPRLTVHTLPG